MNLKSIPTVFVLAYMAASASAAPSELDAAIAKLSHGWAKAEYQASPAEREMGLRSLTADAEQVAQDHPGTAEPLIWEAIVLASAAKAEGGLGALSKVKKARDLLLRAEKINPTALDGSIYCTLGSLYANVPGWPVGYGDKKKAQEYLEKALGLNPNGIDPNFFYGELLAEQGEYAKAAERLKRVLTIPPRTGREDSDAGRRLEATRLLESLHQEHGVRLAGP